jgi:hypothetical protein
MAGTCWNCRIMPVKVATATGSVSWSTGDHLGHRPRRQYHQHEHHRRQQHDDAGRRCQLRPCPQRGLVAAAGNTGDTTLGYAAASPA